MVSAKSWQDLYHFSSTAGNVDKCLSARKAVIEFPRAVLLQSVFRWIVTKIGFVRAITAKFKI